MPYEPPEIITLHASTLDWFFHCPMSAFLSHPQLGNRMEYGRYGTFAGTGYHAGVEANMASVLKDEKMLPLDEVHDRAIEAFRDKVSKIEMLKKPKEKGQKVSDIKNEHEGRIRAGGRAHYQQLAPQIVPARVECKYAAMIEDPRLAIKVKLVGRPDLETEKLIIDNKLRGATPPKSTREAKDSLQLFTYHWLREVAHKAKLAGLEDFKEALPAASGFRLDVVVPLKTKVNVLQLDGEPTERLINQFWEKLGWITAMIKSGLFYPNKKSMFCGAGSCVWYDTGECIESPHYKKKSNS